MMEVMIAMISIYRGIDWADNDKLSSRLYSWEPSVLSFLSKSH